MSAADMTVNFSVAVRSLATAVKAFANLQIAAHPQRIMWSNLHCNVLLTTHTLLSVGDM